MHPSRDLRGAHGDLLEGRRIVLGVTGSIAAVRTVEICHELIRHGADVIPVMTSAAAGIIHPDALWYATGTRPIVALSGAVEHVELAGDRPGRADILLIAPATANTLSKIAHGIDDTPVTTFATTAIGSGMPVIAVPAMHASMHRHPAVEEAISRLRSWGIEVLEPRMAEGKAKLPDVDTIVAHVIRSCGDTPDLRGLRGLVISGPTTEMIDGFRALTNLSTGATGRALARFGFYTGASIEHWHSEAPDLPFLTSRHFRGIDELSGMIAGADADFAFMAAAVGDFRPVPSEGKIPSDSPVTLHLEPTPKVIDDLRPRVRFLVGFKALVDADDDALREAGYEKLQESDLDLVVANDVRRVMPDTTSCVIVRRDGSSTSFTGCKDWLARLLYKEVARGLEEDSED